MERKKRGNRALTFVIVILCIALLAAMTWGVYSLLTILTAYSESTTIGSQAPKPEEPETEEPEPDPLPMNTYDPDGFYEKNGIRYYDAAGVTGIPGIDVSAYQPQIDWQQVKEAGIEFAMIRVGYRGYQTGKLDLDDCFLSHIQGALDAGLQVGVYFFSQALTPEEAVEEAEFVLTWIEGYDITYPVVFDWEEVEGQARTDDMNMLMLTACAEAFCETVEEAGYEAAVYFNQAYGYQQLNLVSLRDYTFWLAEYSEAPVFYHHFQLWQYTNEGTVAGIEGPVDMNIWFETFG